jgi:plastocyanin
MDERGTQARGTRSVFRRARSLALVGASVGVALMLLTTSGDDATASSEDATVAARDDFFTPSSVTINQGETVTWTNEGSNPHNVHFADGFDQPSAPDDTPWRVSRTFTSPGSFSYRCELHSGMTGTVNVNAVPPPPPGEPPTPEPGPPPPDDEPPAGAKSPTTVTLRISDATPTRRQRVRFFGTVRPEQDGRLLQLQRRRRGGSYRTVERIRLRDAGTARSTYSKRLRVVGDAVFRARIPADAAHLAGTSRARRVDVR